MPDYLLFVAASCSPSRITERSARNGFRPPKQIIAKSTFADTWAATAAPCQTSAFERRRRGPERPPWALHCRTAFDGIWPKPDWQLRNAQLQQPYVPSRGLPTEAVGPEFQPFVLRRAERPALTRSRPTQHGQMIDVSRNHCPRP